MNTELDPCPLSKRPYYKCEKHLLATWDKRFISLMQDWQTFEAVIVHHYPIDNPTVREAYEFVLKFTAWEPERVAYAMWDCLFKSQLLFNFCVVTHSPLVGRFSMQ